MLQSLYISFFDWDGLSPTMTFVGLKNYVDIFVNDEVARLALAQQHPVDARRAGAADRDRARCWRWRSTAVSPASTLFRTVFYSPAVSAAGRRRPDLGLGLTTRISAW